MHPLNHPPPDTAWETDHLTPTVPPVYPEDDELCLDGERRALSERVALQAVVSKLLTFIFRRPWGKVPERRLIMIGIVLGVESLHGRTLAEFAKEQGISTNAATEHLRQIREHFGFPANNISNDKFRQACRRGAKKRWSKQQTNNKKDKNEKRMGRRQIRRTETQRVRS